MPLFLCPIFLCYNRIMRKSQSQNSKKTKVKFKFDFKDKTIFEKQTIFEGKPFKIKGIFDLKEPDIQLKERK